MTFKLEKGGPWKSMERRSLLNIALVLTVSENRDFGTLASFLVFGHYNPCEEDLGEEGGVPEGHLVQFTSVAQSCPTLYDPMDCSTPGFTVHHQLLELAQTHVHQVGDAIQPSHPLSSPSPAFNLSEPSGSFPMSQFFASSGQSIGASASASVLPMNIQDWFPLRLTGWISLRSKGLSKVSNITVQKHQFFVTQLSLCSNSHMLTWLLEKQGHWLDGPLPVK